MVNRVSHDYFWLYFSIYRDMETLKKCIDCKILPSCHYEEDGHGRGNWYGFICPSCGKMSELSLYFEDAKREWKEINEVSNA